MKAFPPRPSTFVSYSQNQSHLKIFIVRQALERLRLQNVGVENTDTFEQGTQLNLRVDFSPLLLCTPSKAVTKWGFWFTK